MSADLSTPRHVPKGLLLEDPRDLEAFGGTVSETLVDLEEARRWKAAAEQRVRERFQHDRHLAEWVELVGALVLERERSRSSASTHVSSPLREVRSPAPVATPIRPGDGLLTVRVAIRMYREDPEAHPATRRLHLEDVSGSPAEQLSSHRRVR